MGSVSCIYIIIIIMNIISNLAKLKISSSLHKSQGPGYNSMIAFSSTCFMTSFSSNNHGSPLTTNALGVSSNFSWGRPIKAASMHYLECITGWLSNSAISTTWNGLWWVPSDNSVI
jgi:hypothetical protein